MSNSQTLFYEGKKIRTVQIEDATWWVLRDVCEVLGIDNARMAAVRLDEDEKGVSTVYTLGGPQQLSVISESGLYNIILLSRKPDAKQFKRWVTREVLPSIRKHGVYATAETLEKMLADPDTMIRTLQVLKEERAARKQLEAKIEQDKPKVQLAEAISATPASIYISDLAKILKQNGLDMGEIKLFRWLREHGYLCRSGIDYNKPTQRAMEMGLFEMKENIVVINYEDTIRFTPKVTGKGQQFFIHKFLVLGVAK
jgi:anti-repressor protein